MAYQNLVGSYGPGVGISTIPSVFFDTVDPTEYDSNFPLGQLWVNQTDEIVHILNSFSSTTGAVLANWVALGGETFAQSITTPDSNVVIPIDGNINFDEGDGMTITGDVSTATITFSSTSAGYAWDYLATGTTSQAISVGNAYVPTASSLVTFSLPTTAAFGQTFGIVGYGSGGWKISQASGQSIIMGSSTSTPGTTGYIASSLASDSVFVVCIIANTTFKVIQSMGNIAVN